MANGNNIFKKYLSWFFWIMLAVIFFIILYKWALVIFGFLVILVYTIKKIIIWLLFK